MTELMFLQDAYRKEATATVVGHTPEGGILLDQTLFYATSGGQPGDSGVLKWDGHELEIATAVKTPDGGIALVPSAPEELPAVGTEVFQVLDWARRHRHAPMRCGLRNNAVSERFPISVIREAVRWPCLAIRTM